jgi:hydroxyethylthiazole kinase-like uncharacterized protein yjeF
MMQKLISSAQMSAADAFTIQKKEITAIDLMEAAAQGFVQTFVQELTDKTTAIALLCGKGNNGADGLSIARLLKEEGYTDLTVYLVDFSAKETPEYKVNLERLQELWFPTTLIQEPAAILAVKAPVIIDAILGSGLNKPLTGNYLELVNLVNSLNRQVIAVDVPTGFPSEGVIAKDNVCLQADLVICFQRPKINFFFPESVAALARFRVADIGLDEAFIQSTDSAYQLMDGDVIRQLVKPRKLFTHKGTYGHALIIAGQKETMGAALLSAKAALHTGAGLTTLSIPSTGLTALNATLPEVMYLDRAVLGSTGLDKFKVTAVGPGLGTDDEATALLSKLLQLKKPMVIDADALNIMAQKKELLKLLTPDSVLTPHMKEFDHLFGKHDSWWERLEMARQVAKIKSCVIVLKNQYTFVVDQEGLVTINPTGNPAMAQGGMGDVLTGIISSFIAQGYTAIKAAQIGCYLHGKAGDELAELQIAVTASQLAERLSVTLKGLII